MIIKKKSFVFGFFFGYFVYLVSAKVFDGGRRPFCPHCIEEYGFPFTSYEIGGYVTQTNIIWLGVSGNILFASIFSIILGLLCYLVVKKLTAKRNELE